MNKFNKIMKLTIRLGFASLVAVGVLSALGGGANAAPRPVAIVEESARNDGIGRAFSLLSESDSLKLAKDETIVLGYLKSCVRETITGGIVTVGAKESVVEGGKVTREKTECAENKLALTAGESQQSATIAFRGTVKHIFTLQPVIMAGTSSGVTIEAVQSGEVWQVVPDNGRIDFRAAKLQMQPGTNYKVIGATHTVIVEVDPAADTAKTGLLERVVILD